MANSGGSTSIAALWLRARAGEFRATAATARAALDAPRGGKAPARGVELHLIIAFALLRQGDHAGALRELDGAMRLAEALAPHSRARLHVLSWQAELAYVQGRYSTAVRICDALLPELERAGDHAYLAFALRVRIAVLLARGDYDVALTLADRAVGAADASGDRYVLVQILNILGAVYFDRATSKLAGPHARAHLTSLDPADVAPMEADANKALDLFKHASRVAEKSGNTFAAWYVAGNIERLEILLGHAERALRPMRKRLAQMQIRGARYDEIATRSNLAWALRTLARHREALHELDVAFELARSTGTANALIEFLEYDRSIVLDSLGEYDAARASYRRYLQLIDAQDRSAESPGSATHAKQRAPLEPYFLKRADRFIFEHLLSHFTIAQLAKHCGVGWSTLEGAFSTFRGTTPVAFVRNLRLDRAHAELGDARCKVGVAAIASRHGFRSPTTFSLEYRKRFGIAPSKTRRIAQTPEALPAEPTGCHA